ncbi:ATP-binding protein [Shimia sp.]|uniref:PAS domain-containing hybrid sensor histidine kinase/response regulator n=1 Tax=Shimia sp. TaxID=1954381 RepID=UPI003B8D6D99
MTAVSNHQLLRCKDIEREECDLLTQYANERLAALWRRVAIYALGWLLIVGHTSLLFGTLATAILLFGEAVDCFVLRQVQPRLNRGDDLGKVRRLAYFSGILQGLSMVGTSVFYVLTFGEDSSILGITAVLAMGVVNAALILPTNPTIAIFKLVLFVSTPVTLLVYKQIRYSATSEIQYPELMVVLSMGFMSFSFAKAALENFRRNRELKRSQVDLYLANKKLESQQRELQKLSMVARKTSDAVILMDAEQNIEWVNDSFSNLTQISADWALGRPFHELLALSNGWKGFQALVEEALKQGEAQRAELRNEEPNGTVRWADVHLVPVKSDEGVVDFFVTIGRDTSAIKEHSETMKAARLSAEDAAKTKADFLASMSHEIRTPLTGIIGMADLLSETEQTPDQVDFTQTILGSSRSLLTILNDILDLSKMEAGKLEINATAFDTRACFDDTIRLLQPAALDKGLSLNLTFDAQLSDQLVADDIRLRQILTNIIGNATKFTEHGSIDVDVWCTQTQQKAGEAQTLLHFSVEDTGIGIPENKLSTIFDGFSQAETSTTRRFGGTGLGLTICQVLAQMMGGGIEVESTYGAGSRFTVSLPVDVPDKDTVAAGTGDQNGAPEYDAIDLVGLDVLVAEDNKTNRLLIRKFLEPLPISLRFANDGYDAVEATMTNPPDVIFMDMSMPNMSGIEATEAIRASDVRQPAIIALTANAFESERQLCLAAGMDDFLTKPIRRADLVISLQKQAARRIRQTSAEKSALEA